MTPRLLLHGFTGNAETFAHLAELANARTPVLPGHGKAPPATSWEAALDRLEPQDKVVLAGYSMGARLALGIALRRPEKIEKLVLISGTAGIEDPLDRMKRQNEDEKLAREIEHDGVPAFIKKWEQHPSLSSLKPFADQLRPQRLSHTPEGLASALRHLGPGSQPSYWSELPNLKVPVLILAGKDDDKFVDLAIRMHRALPDCELRVLSKCGHAPHLERPDAVTEALK
jgi:2-succinyl-6-hydroxy-2,4-cyclohexadiene-1-carboxylate synthase